MPKVLPFRAIRYIPKKSDNNISEFICPPYDVISPLEREKLVKLSEQNVVQLELPEGEGQEKYMNAAKRLHEWERNGIVQLDRSPSLYVLETTYRIDDPFAPSKKLKRYGVMAALQLEPPGRGAVLPHEKTLPKAKEDRLNLIKAIQANISPIFGLFFDKQNKWGAWVKQATKGTPLSNGNEKVDLDHRLWKVDDPKMIKEFCELLDEKSLYIADGHHRYEVAWAYMEARLKGEPNAELNPAWRSVMTYICPMEDPGLLMLPTHRLVRSNRTLAEWKTHLETFFDIKKVDSSQAMVEALSKAEKGSRLIGYISQEGLFLLSIKKGVSVDRCLEHRPAALRELDVVFLHDMVFSEAPGSDFLKNPEIVNTRDIAGMIKTTKDDSNWVGFVLASAGVESLARVAADGEVMPPKTTYFYPKVPTGFTVMPLDQVLR